MSKNSETKSRLTFRPSDETRQRIEQWYKADNSTSLNDFIEKAVNDYIDRLEINDDNCLLPTAISSAINGRLGLLEKNLSSLSFNHAVELDMLVGIIAETFNFSREDLQRLRAQSVKNVKNTNGRISLEKRAQRTDEYAQSQRRKSPCERWCCRRRYWKY